MSFSEKPCGFSIAPPVLEEIATRAAQAPATTAWFRISKAAAEAKRDNILQSAEDQTAEENSVLHFSMQRKSTKPRSTNRKSCSRGTGRCSPGANARVKLQRAAAAATRQGHQHGGRYATRREPCENLRGKLRCFFNVLRKTTVDVIPDGDHLTWPRYVVDSERHLRAVSRTNLRRGTCAYSYCSWSNLRWIFPATAKRHLRHLQLL